MKHKYTRKDKKIKKSKSPKNSKKIVKAKKASRRYDTKLADKLERLEVPERPVTLGFEASASEPIEPIEPDALVELAADAIPGDPTEAV